jgi:hypothetical protein
MMHSILQDFATPSLRVEVERDDLKNMPYDKKYEIDPGRFWDGRFVHFDYL